MVDSEGTFPQGSREWLQHLEDEQHRLEEQQRQIEERRRRVEEMLRQGREQAERLEQARSRARLTAAELEQAAALLRAWADSPVGTLSAEPDWLVRVGSLAHDALELSESKSAAEAPPGVPEIVRVQPTSTPAGNTPDPVPAQPIGATAEGVNPEVKALEPTIQKAETALNEVGQPADPFGHAAPTDPEAAGQPAAPAVDTSPNRADEENQENTSGALDGVVQIPASVSSAAPTSPPAGPGESPSIAERPSADEEVERLALEWSGSWEHLPEAYLAAVWLRANGMHPPLDPALLRLAHYAFHEAPPGYPAALDSLLVEIDRPGAVSELEKPAAWAIGAGLVLLGGWLQGLPLFMETGWSAGANAAQGRTVSVLTTYWNRVAEPLPVVLGRVRAARQSPEGAEQARIRALERLHALLSRRMKFPLGLKVLAHLRKELKWLDDELVGQSDADLSQRLASWARALNPQEALDNWAKTVDPTHPTGIIPPTRPAMLRDLGALREALLDWIALAPALTRAAGNAEGQQSAAWELGETLKREADAWCEGWGADGAGAMIRLLIRQLNQAFATSSDLERVP